MNEQANMVILQSLIIKEI